MNDIPTHEGAGNPYHWDLLLILKEIREQEPDLAREQAVTRASLRLIKELVEKTGHPEGSSEILALLNEALEKAQDLNPKAFE